jgi:hypothetical protein
MLRSLFSRITQRGAPLPLLAAFLPECFRGARSPRELSAGLHVYAKTMGSHDDYCKVHVSKGADAGNLKDAVRAKLQLDVMPDCVRLLREVEGGSAPVPLDSRRKLDEQGVAEGSSLIVEIMAPLAFSSGDSSLPRLTVGANPALHVAFCGLEQSPWHTMFYRAVCAAPAPALCPASGTRMWRLSHPAHPSQPLKWPFLGAWALVERDFYSRFLREGQWLGGLEGQQCKVAVLGHPGIGKSAFGVWLLAQLLRSNRTVVYSRKFSKPGVAADVKHFVYHRGAAFKLRSSELGCIDALLQDPAWCTSATASSPKVAMNATRS